MALMLNSTRTMQFSRCAARQAVVPHMPVLPHVASTSGRCDIAFAPARPALRHRATVRVEAAAKAAATVKIVIQGRKLPVTDAIKGYVEEKVSRALANYAHTIKEVDVTLSARGGDTGTKGSKEQKVDVTIYTLRNGVVRVEDAEDTLYASIDVVCDKLERKMGRIKDRAIAKGKWPGRAGPRGAAEDEAEFQEYLQEIKYETAVFDKEQRMTKQFAELNRDFPAAVRRTKVLELDPISVDEAIDAMEAVGHDFFVFRELESDSIQVVYRRESEGYGVLIPKKRD
mmetsp:Transcript_5315/g.13080  ORF Transcript_5315/g.13080 Transcript_5315/m.13080 type:complete len:285 (-) Transcript_5315:760-1614(-)|eukprot:CAMPEP_0202868962 /NCGR_PEP_ID=MMETSP1391-20130828/11458_1 /ASSEMBLY_ACC=CAM_ASM_000867 /TAXON_ID=1034604 /ORGANISM="Chlamydomonas leiostraca, Strain SAG 11-49" /LENGTH=284 /DNA_ID=CAMNT_0049549195 /DNA_START=120 /DNA_END=974 /DNA_ORIENTATION=+